MPISPENIVAMRDALAASDPTLTPAQLLQGVRTLVHVALQVDSTPPYPLPPAPKGKARADFIKALRGASAFDQKRLHDEEGVILAQRKAAMHASVPAEVHVAFQRERPPGIRDPHHYAQWLHGKALWAEANKLVVAAGIPGAAAAVGAS